MFMTTVEEIEAAIQHLPKDKLAEFRRWFEEYDATEWDKQFEQDAKAGRLDTFADQAVRDLKEGRCTEL
jgi:hypothetical protein